MRDDTKELGSQYLFFKDIKQDETSRSESYKEFMRMHSKAAGSTSVTRRGLYLGIVIDQC